MASAVRTLLLLKDSLVSDVKAAQVRFSLVQTVKAAQARFSLVQTVKAAQLREPVRASAAVLPVARLLLRAAFVAATSGRAAWAVLVE